MSEYLCQRVSGCVCVINGVCVMVYVSPKGCSCCVPGGRRGATCPTDLGRPAPDEEVRNLLPPVIG